MTGSNDIRAAFLDYFRRHGHEIVPSSPLVPAHDPTLLFTNAGMVQFKELFLGLERRPYLRAASAQRCVRAGGKHNDLENVGYTTRHHTFFEMLGNFSFGDYFKREAIAYAWEFLTGVLRIPPARLWVTVFKDDEEAAEVWLKEMRVDPRRFSRCGEKDNFWAMGETGPCGPCSEIFYDHGENIPGGPPGTPEADSDRYVEIWNLVFMQYDRDGEGSLQPIPRPGVDTGMGLERIAAVMQGVHNNYEIDIFRDLIAAIHRLGGRKKMDPVSTRVVADHIRACAFLIADGVIPSNEGRGYVLRRIIRRAVRHGHKLGFKESFFHKLVDPLCEVMGRACPELPNTQDFVRRTLKNEEERFAETLELGIKYFEQVRQGLIGKVIPGEAVFKLYDTYGFPVDLTANLALEYDLIIDQKGFDAAMAAQRARARAASRFDAQMAIGGGQNLTSEFSGYDREECSARITALFRDGRAVQTLEVGEQGGVILDTTAFYAESGGQVGDQGELTAEGVLFEVGDTQKQGKAHVHIGRVVRGALAVGAEVRAHVNQRRRRDIMRNHSATHLLHAALRQVLGRHVTQKGSLVAPDRLRFDFAHPEPVTAEQLREIERLINHRVLANQDTRVEVMPLEKAMQSGAMSLFGEKYDDLVRVLAIGGEFSVELCGGTHVSRAGDIGLFKIVSETGIAAGVRRIEAVTGEGALQWVEQVQARLDDVAALLKADADNMPSRLEQLVDRNRKLEKEVAQLKGRLASSAGDDMAGEALNIGGIKVLARCLDGADPKSLRDTVDQLKNKLGTAALVLATVQDSRVSLVAGVTPDSTDRIKAGDLVNFVAQQVGGKGGGRPDMAQAGGSDPGKLEAALASVPEWVRRQLAG
ncbi:MAG: alanine--tRNA ligase [Gammaproteobacteria bacterium]|nr:alanine--tRNA ligase [Gammaproteobacteria bacterium]